MKKTNFIVSRGNKETKLNKERHEIKNFKLKKNFLFHVFILINPYPSKSLSWQKKMEMKSKVDMIEKILSDHPTTRTLKEVENFVFSAFNSIDNESLSILNIIYRSCYGKEIFSSNPRLLDTAMAAYLYNSLSETTLNIVKWLVEKKAVFSPTVMFGFLDNNNLEVAKVLCEYFIDVYPTVVALSLKRTLEKGNISFAEFVLQRYPQKEDLVFFLVKYLPLRKDIVELFEPLFALLDDYKIGLLTILSVSEGNTKVLDKILRKCGCKPFNKIPAQEWFPLFRFLISEKKVITSIKWFNYRKYKNRYMSQLEMCELVELASKHLKRVDVSAVCAYLKTFCGLEEK